MTLSEVRPDGKETYVQSGWLRASHRKLNDAALLPVGFPGGTTIPAGSPTPHRRGRVARAAPDMVAAASSRRRQVHVAARRATDPPPSVRRCWLRCLLNQSLKGSHLGPY